MGRAGHEEQDPAATNDVGEHEADRAAALGRIGFIIHLVSPRSAAQGRSHAPISLRIPTPQSADSPVAGSLLTSRVPSVFVARLR